MYLLFGDVLELICDWDTVYRQYNDSCIGHTVQLVLTERGGLLGGYYDHHKIGLLISLSQDEQDESSEIM